MKRLTGRRDGRTYIVGCPDFALPKIAGLIIQKTVDRLAAYEDTGLEPEEIKAIAGLASENCAKTADAIDKLLQDDAELKSYRELGSIDRLRELAQADREGRCVVFVSGYPVVSIYGKAEDGLCIREVSGVITEEEYKAALQQAILMGLWSI